MDSRRAAGWNGRTARWRRCFPPRIPESLRGPQFAAAWCDELAKWRHAEATFDMLQFGLRLGERPRQVITTTPRPIALHQAADRRSDDRGDARRRRAPTRSIWRRRSSTPWSRAMPARGSAARSSTARSSRSAPTRCGRAALIESCRVDAAPPLQRIVVAVDPPASASKARRRLRPGRRRPRRGRHDLCDRRRDRRRAVAGRLGAQGDRAVAPAFAPTRWSSRSTRAATWCAR